MTSSERHDTPPPLSGKIAQTWDPGFPCCPGGPGSPGGPWGESEGSVKLEGIMVLRCQGS